MIEMFLQNDNFLVYLAVNEDDNAIRNSATKHRDIDPKKRNERWGSCLKTSNNFHRWICVRYL